MKFIGKWTEWIFTPEYRDNTMYGHGQILRKYVGARLPYRMPAPLTHGWHCGCGIHGDLGKHGKKEKARKYFVWNIRHVEESRKLGYSNVTAIGAPFLYLPRECHVLAKNCGAKSLLLFPDHSSEMEPFVDTVGIYERYLHDIEALLTSFGNVTVCLYWYQYENEKVRALFNAKGIPIVTLGHRDHSHKFLADFCELARKYSYISSNKYCTATMYGLYLRRKVFIYGIPVKQEDRKLTMWVGRQAYDNRKWEAEYPELLWDNFDDKSHYEIAEKELGLEFKRTPEELRELFGWKPSCLVRQIASRIFWAARRRWWRLSAGLDHTKRSSG